MTDASMSLEEVCLSVFAMFTSGLFFLGGGYRKLIHRRAK